MICQWHTHSWPKIVIHGNSCIILYTCPVNIMIANDIATHGIDPSYKTHNASDKYPTRYHFVTEVCTRVHISVTKWCIVRYGTGAMWDLWAGSIGASAGMMLTYLSRYISVSASGAWFNIKMSSYQYRKSHCGDKTVVRSSYLHKGFPILVRKHLYIESGPRRF